MRGAWRRLEGGLAACPPLQLGFSHAVQVKPFVADTLRALPSPVPCVTATQRPFRNIVAMSAIIISVRRVTAAIQLGTGAGPRRLRAHRIVGVYTCELDTRCLR